MWLVVNVVDSTTQGADIFYYSKSYSITHVKTSSQY